MPSKKSTQSHGADKENRGAGSQRPSSPLFKEGVDPLETVVSIVEKRARNLSKRKDRLTSLKKECEEGKGLDKDQLEAISKLPDVLVQIDFLRDLQKQFAEMNLEYQKHLKSTQKAKDKRKKEEESATRKSSIEYSLRVQVILDQLDESTKTCFRNGSEGAVKLTDSELKQLDDFYHLVNPQRPGNPSYEQDVVAAAQHLTQLQEESTAKVVHTDYKTLHKMFEKIDACGFLDKPRVEEACEEEDEEEVVEEEREEHLVDREPPVDDFTSLEEVPADVLKDDPSTVHHTSEVLREDRVHQTTPTQTSLMFGDNPPPEPIPQQSGNTASSVPSPDFVGLGSSTLAGSLDFQFMRGDPQPQSQPPPTSHVTTPSFTSTFNSGGDKSLAETTPTSHEVSVDGQYVPETGQQMNDKSDLVGPPVVGSTSDNLGDQSNGSFKSQGNGRSFSSYGKQSQRSNNNRRGPYNRTREQRGDGSGFVGGGGSSKNSGGGRPRGNGGRGGRPNYTYNRDNRPPQNRSNGPRNNTRPQQPSYASTAAQSS